MFIVQSKLDGKMKNFSQNLEINKNRLERSEIGKKILGLQSIYSSRTKDLAATHKNCLSDMKRMFNITDHQENANPN